MSSSSTSTTTSSFMEDLYQQPGGPGGAQSRAEGASQPGSSFLDELQTVGQQIAMEDSLEDIEDTKTAATFFKVIQNEVMSDRTKNKIMSTGEFNLIIYYCSSKSIRCNDVNATQIEPTEFIDDGAWKKLSELIKFHLIPYKTEKRIRKGFVEGTVYYIISCCTTCTMNRTGNVTYDPTVRLIPDNSKSLVCRQLCAWQREFLDHTIFDQEHLFNIFLERWNSTMKLDVARKLSKQPVVIRILFNNIGDRKSIADGIHQEIYIFKDPLNICQVEDLISRIKTFMKGEIVPQCHFPELIRTSPWSDDKDTMMYHTTLSKSKLDICQIVADFLLVPKGTVPLSIHL